MMTTQQAQQQRIKTPSEALPPDGLSRFVRAGAWAAIVSGVAMAVSLLMVWLVVPFERLGQTEAYFTSSYLVATSLLLLSSVLLLWGLIGIYSRQSRAAGNFGMWAFIVAFLGTGLVAGNNWAQVFVWPTFAQVAPNLISTQVMSGQAHPSPYLTAGLGLSAPFFFIGLILFAVATIRAGVYPRWASVLLIISIPATMFLDPTVGAFQESIGQILLGIAVAALGFYALRRAPSTTSS